MNVKLIGKHEKDSRACRDGLALTLDEMMGQDKSICYVDCDLMGCINTKRLREHYPDRAFEAGIAEGNAAGVSAGLAATGKKVFFHSFGTFSSRRCYDQIYMSAAYAGLTVHVLGVRGRSRQAKRRLRWLMARSLGAMVSPVPSLRKLRPLSGWSPMILRSRPDR